MSFVCFTLAALATYRATDDVRIGLAVFLVGLGIQLALSDATDAVRHCVGREGRLTRSVAEGSSRPDLAPGCVSREVSYVLSVWFKTVADEPPGAGGAFHGHAYEELSWHDTAAEATEELEKSRADGRAVIWCIKRHTEDVIVTGNVPGSDGDPKRI